MLSHETEVTVPVTLPGLATSVRMTRGEFEAGITESLHETLAQTRSAMRSAEVRGADLHAVVLIGGSSRIPLVTELLQRELRVRPAVDAHPKHHVALGAARLGAPVVAPVSTDPAPTHRPGTATLARDPDYVAALTALKAEDWTRAGDLLARVAARFPGETRVLEPLGRARAGSLRAQAQAAPSRPGIQPAPTVGPMSPASPTDPAPPDLAATHVSTTAPVEPAPAQPAPDERVAPRVSRRRSDGSWGAGAGTRPRRRRVVLAVAGAVVVALVVGLLLARARPAAPVVDPTPTAPVTPFGAGPVKPPTITGHRSGDRAVFTWDGYSGQQAGDSYQLRWTISGHTTESGGTTKPRAARKGKATICLTVQVRANGVLRADYGTPTCL